MLTADWQTPDQMAAATGRPIGYVLGYLKLAQELGTAECSLPEAGGWETIWRAAAVALLRWACRDCRRAWRRQLNSVSPVQKKPGSG